MANNGKLIEPHGGKLINRVMSDKEKSKILNELDEFDKIQIDTETWKNVKNVCFGVFSPLEGFMIENETLRVLDNMRLENNIPWPFPIVLDIAHSQASKLRVNDNTILTNDTDYPIALLKIDDIYEYDKKKFAEKVYSTLDRSHPGVDKIYNLDDWLIGGDLFLINELPAMFPDLDLKPNETRKIFKERNGDKICPHLPECHTNFSGTEIRKLLCSGKKPPKEVMRPEVTKVILEYENPFYE